MSTTPTSDASTKVDGEAGASNNKNNNNNSNSDDDAKASESDSTMPGAMDSATAQDTLQRARTDPSTSTSTTTAQNIFLFLLAFRILNALSVRTFFQPDEYFQALEPAWEIAFGPKSGAWITWVWDCSREKPKR